MAYNASERKQVRAAEKAARTAELIRTEFLSAAMTTPQGRAWFFDLLEFCHLFTDPFSGDALREAYSKGERNIGLKIFADILAYCPDQYITMMREANERRAATERPISPDDGRDIEGYDLDSGADT